MSPLRARMIEDMKLAGLAAVSSPLHVERSMRISRTALPHLLHVEVYGTYRRVATPPRIGVNMGDVVVRRRL